MPNTTFVFVRKTYKTVIFLVLTIAFFLFYNAYLVDRSVINLKVVLDKLSTAKTVADFEKIKPLIKVCVLKEIAKKTASAKDLILLQAVENIGSSATTPEQLEGIRMYLKTIVARKENERGRLMSAIDTLNTAIFKPQTEISAAVSKSTIKHLLAKAKSAKDVKAAQEAYYELGNAYLQADNLAEAKEPLLKSIEAKPKTELAIKAKFNLAWVCKSAANYIEAVNYFEAVSIETQEKELRISARQQIIDVHRKQGEYLKAADEYAEFARRFPEFGIADVALYEAAYISFYNLKDRPRALKFLSQLEKKFPRSEIVKHEMNKLKPLLSADYRRKGFELLKKKRYVEANDNVSKAVNIAPLDSRSWSGMALGFYWLGEKGRALEMARKAVEASSGDEISITNALFVYIRCGRINEAIRIGEEALSKYQMERAEFYYNLGCAYLASKNRDKLAAKMFERAVQLNPRFASAYNNLSYAYLIEHSYDKAISQYKEAIAKNPNLVKPHFNLGLTYFYLQRQDEAYQEFQKVLKLDPENKKAEDYIRKIEQSRKYKP
jgi:tetratricopeptide (TPR) repeat protein